MLIKLIKNEFKPTYLLNIILCSATVAFSLVLSLLIRFYANNASNNSDIIAITNWLIFVIYILIPLLFVSIGVICSTIINSVSTRLFGDQSILTFTLPVKTGELILAKYIVNIIWMIFGIFTLILCVLIFTLNLSDLLNDFFGVEIFSESIGSLLLFGLNALISCIYFYSLIFLASSITYITNYSKNKKMITFLLILAFIILMNVIMKQVQIIPFYINDNFEFLRKTKDDLYMSQLFDFNAILFKVLFIVLSVFGIYNLIHKRLDL